MELWRKVILFRRGLKLPNQVLLQVVGVGKLQFGMRSHNFLHFPHSRVEVKTPGRPTAPFLHYCA